MHKPNRSLIFDLSVFVGALAMLGYLGWHGTNGPRSFDYEKTVKLKLKERQAKLDAVNKHRDQKNIRVSLLRSQTIDPDMLDEMARKVLEFAHKDQIITYLKLE